MFFTDLADLNLPKTCQMDFPDPDDLLNFRLVVMPDEVYMYMYMYMHVHCTLYMYTCTCTIYTVQCCMHDTCTCVCCTGLL